MKKLFFGFFLASFIAVSLSLSSCKKDTQASVVFWYDLNTAKNLKNDGANALFFYFDGELLTSTSTDVYWSGEPSCDVSGAVEAKETLKKGKNQTFSYYVQDQTGFIYWSGEVSLSGSECNAIKLDW